MLIVVAISNCIFTKSTQTFYITCCEVPFNKSDVRQSIIVFAISGYISLVLYTLAHWAIAYKYWQLSFMLSFQSLKNIERTNIFIISGVITSELIVLVVQLYLYLTN
jgi:hypothetical protein